MLLLLQPPPLLLLWLVLVNMEEEDAVVAAVPVVVVESEEPMLSALGFKGDTYTEVLRSSPCPSLPVLVYGRSLPPLSPFSSVSLRFCSRLDMDDFLFTMAALK